MKIFLLPLIFFPLFITGCYQTKDADSRLNLNFEAVENGKPKKWIISQYSDYSISLDSVNVRSGKYALAIEITGDSAKFQMFQLPTFVLPNHYREGKITLSGYIKTENVMNGYAGLWMTVDPQFAFEDILVRNEVAGTTDWTKYEITLELNQGKTHTIFFGGLLVGRGKMWLDDLRITIDDKDVNGPELFSEKGKNDIEFDNGSNIIFPELSEQKIDDLELLGRVWGFMKYHHPAIAKGNYNWDYELFRVLPDYLKVNDHQQRDKILIKWINKYGRIPKCKTCRTTPIDAILKPDLSWIEYSDFNLKLKNLLQKMYVNRNQDFHYYISHSLLARNPIFQNERAYEKLDDPDVGFRLLALYRYWNMIHYFSPYRYLTDKKWDTVLKEYIPEFIEAKGRLEYELTAARLIWEVCDTHASLSSGWDRIASLKGSGQVSALLQFIEGKLVVVDYYNTGGEKFENLELRRGDVITHIEGEAVMAIVDSIKRYYPASNEAARMRDIARDILRSDKHYIHVGYESSEKKGQKEIYVDRIGRNRKWDNTKSYRFIGNDIGYIDIETIKRKDIPVVMEEFKNTKGIVIDIRGYPSDVISYSLGSYFVSEDTHFMKSTVGNINNPGEFTFKEEYSIRKSENTYLGKVVVIVNEQTQSAAEFLAMQFQVGNKTTIIGSQTAGANGNVSEIILPGGLRTRISGIGIYYPDGRETQRTGIVPDIEVKPTIQGIREGRDELLEKAIEIINKR